MAIYQWKYRRRHLGTFLTLIPLIFFVYTASFLEFFIHQHKSLLDFLYYQWWVVRWRMGNPIVVGNIILGILFGKAKVWWTLSQNYQYWTEEWSLLMPVIVITAYLSIFIWYKNHFFNIIYIYLTLFMVYIIFVTEGGLKYLAPLYPFFTLFSGATFLYFIEKISNFNLYKKFHDYFKLPSQTSN